MAIRDSLDSAATLGGASVFGDATSRSDWPEGPAGDLGSNAGWGGVGAGAADCGAFGPGLVSPQISAGGETSARGAGFASGLPPAFSSRDGPVARSALDVCCCVSSLDRSASRDCRCSLVSAAWRSNSACGRGSAANATETSEAVSTATRTVIDLCLSISICPLPCQPMCISRSCYHDQAQCLGVVALHRRRSTILGANW